MEGGFTREEFEYHLRTDLISFWEPQLEPKQTEDAFQALNFFYSPWPYTNDTDLNREAFNWVRSPLKCFHLSLEYLAHPMHGLRV